MALSSFCSRLFIPLLLHSSVFCEDVFLKDEALAQELIQFIEGLSEFKPLKCSASVPKTHNQDTDSNVWIQSRSCLLNEEWIPFLFTGRINELNQLTGPGKFTLQKRDSYNHKGNFSTCIDFPRVFDNNARIVSLIGTFVNGTIHGNAKVTFDSGLISILSFQNGVPHGLKRDFDSNKHLLDAEIMSNGFPVGYAWKRLSDDIFLIDYRHTNDTIRESNVDLYSTLILDTANHKFLGGTFPRFVNNLYNIYKPKSLKFAKDSDKCIKDLSWEKTEPLGNHIYSLTGLYLVPDSPTDFFLEESDLSAPQRLIRFRKYLVKNKTTVSHSFRHLLGPVKEESKLPLLANIVKKEGHKSYDGILLGKRVNFKHHRGLLDVNGEFHGNTWLEIELMDQSEDIVTNTSITYLALQFLHGKIQDGATILSLSDSRSAHTRLVSGCLHGPLIIHGVVPILPVKNIKKRSFHDTGTTILMYNSGHRETPFWIGMFGLGALTGTLNETGFVSGKYISYLYPDMETSYVGVFEDKIMRDAHLGDVASVSWEKSLIPSITFKMSEEETRSFYYEPPTNNSIGAGPRILDPYDAKRVYLSEAGEFGEGVISKVDMEVGDIACLYNYHIYYPEDRAEYENSCVMNVSKSDDERRHCIKYSLSIQYLNANLNVPPEKDTPDMFLPTLGMKLNHKFYESHASFMDFESPRWGIVSSIALYFKPVKAGEQIFVDYGYRVRGNFPSDFPWFWDLKDSVDAKAKAKMRADLKKKKKKNKKVAKKQSK